MHLSLLGFAILILTLSSLTIAPIASYSQTNSEADYESLIITEVELSSTNGTQWIELYNPTATSFSTPLLINQSNSDKAMLFSSVMFQSNEYNVIQIWNGEDGEGFQTEDGILHVFVSDTVEIDRTPPLSDNLMDSRTWQLNGTEWVFAEATPTRAIPEFSGFIFAMLALSIPIALTLYLKQIKKTLANYL